MRTQVFNMFKELGKNNFNFISYYENDNRIVKTFCELSNDIDLIIQKLNYLRTLREIKTIGILGNTSYEWMLFDLACIKGGFKTVAIPETLQAEQVNEIISNNEVSFLLLDYTIKSRFTLIETEHYYFKCGTVAESKNFMLLPASDNYINNEENNILEEYGIAFSSGTSKHLKRILLKFIPRENKKKGPRKKIQELIKLIAYKSSFWSAKDNKILIFMPFSHWQQRDFVITSLLMKINIALSDTANALRHLIVEKPNILVSVPAIYEALAKQVEIKVNTLPIYVKTGIVLFNKLRINRLPNRNPVKRLASRLLFKEISPIYGGKADFFVTGSAPVNTDALFIFYKIGVKIYQGYGQSEIGSIALNSNNHFRIGSVGKPLVDVKISDESEIMVKYKENTHAHNKEILTIDSDGYIHTGDLGYLDSSGFLFLTGRKDDVIILSNGKKVFPEDIERKIANTIPSKQALVFSKDSVSLSAILAIDTAVNDKKYNQYLELIRTLNASLAEFQRINDFLLVAELFTVENGLLTGTLKLKRAAIIEAVGNKRFYPVNGQPAGWATEQ